MPLAIAVLIWQHGGFMNQELRTQSLLLT